MAVKHLPVIQPDPMQRPLTVGDCRGGPRPCAYLSCKFNLLLDTLEDGSLVLNAPSKRAAGHERPIPNKHQHAQDLTWYVEVRLPPRRVKGEMVPQIFALGPLLTVERATKIANEWIALHGPDTALAHRKLPPELKLVGQPRDGALDARFADEADDAVEYWFDEPNPNMPSCLLDEIDRLDKYRRAADDGHLLEEISKLMYVSRERVRQVEASAMAKLIARLNEMGLTLADLTMGG